MKKYIIYITISLFSWTASAQYQSLFGDSVTEWKLQEPDTYFGLSDLFYRSDTILVVGIDTFHRVEKNSDMYPSANETLYIKEDLQAGKYWAYNESLSSFSLLMDLELQLGDELGVNNWFVSEQAEVDSVYLDTEGRKHIRFNSGRGFINKFEMIEGVGTSCGIGRFHIAQLDSYLICQSKDELLFYEWNHPSVQNCHYSTLGIEENTVDFQLFPNPASDQVQLKTEIPIDLSQLVLSDAIGQKIDLNWISEDSFSVNQLQSGLYFMTYSLDGRTVSRTLMVEN